MRSRRLSSLSAAVLVLAAVAACSTSASTTPGTGSSSPLPGEAAAASASSGGGGGANGYEGSLVTSEAYDATWTVSPDVPADPLNSTSHATLTSDKGTFGNIRVQPDGSVSFGSAAAELSGQYEGTGARVTLDATGGFVCAFTVDTDLAASGGATLHIAGGLTVHWHPEGLGDLNCP